MPSCKNAIVHVLVGDGRQRGCLGWRLAHGNRMEFPAEDIVWNTISMLLIIEAIDCDARPHDET